MRALSMRFISFWRFLKVVVMAVSLIEGIRLGPAPGRLRRRWARLPARFARLARDFAIILVRESFASASAPAPPIAAAVAPAFRSARPARPGRLRLGASFVHLQIAPADFLAIES